MSVRPVHWIKCYFSKISQLFVIPFVPLNQRPRQHGRRTVFNDHNQQSQTNKQFDLKYKETTLALGLTNIQNKREINWNSTKNLLL